MIVYHGSTVIVENPDVKHSYRALDFVCRCRDGEKDYLKYDQIAFIRQKAEQRLTCGTCPHGRYDMLQR